MIAKERNKITNIEAKLGFEASMRRGISCGGDQYNPPAIAALRNDINAVNERYRCKSPREIRRSGDLLRDASSLFHKHGPILWPDPRSCKRREDAPWLIDANDDDLGGKYSKNLFYTNSDDRVVLHHTFIRMVIEKCVRFRANERYRKRKGEPVVMLSRPEQPPPALLVDRSWLPKDREQSDTFPNVQEVHEKDQQLSTEKIMASRTVPAPITRAPTAPVWSSHNVISVSNQIGLRSPSVPASADHRIADESRLGRQRSPQQESGRKRGRLENEEDDDDDRRPSRIVSHKLPCGYKIEGPCRPLLAKVEHSVETQTCPRRNLECPLPGVSALLSGHGAFRPLCPMQTNSPLTGWRSVCTRTQTQHNGCALLPGDHHRQSLTLTLDKSECRVLKEALFRAIYKYVPVERLRAVLCEYEISHGPVRCSIIENDDADDTFEELLDKVREECAEIAPKLKAVVEWAEEP